MSEHLSADGSVAYLTKPGVMLQVYRGRATGAHVPVLQQLSDDAVLKPRAVQLIVVSPRSMSSAPDEAFRKGAGQLFADDTLAHLVASAIVVPVGGFLGATARAIMSGMSFFARRERQQGTFASVDEGAAWLIGAAPDLGLTVAGLVDDAAALQARLDALHR